MAVVVQSPPRKAFLFSLANRSALTVESCSTDKTLPLIYASE